jgi:hypothetical protein
MSASGAFPLQGQLFQAAGKNPLIRSCCCDLTHNYRTKALPTNREMDLTNGEIRLACQERLGCWYLDLNTRLKADGHLALGFDAGDGIHISPAGSEILAAMVSELAE